MKESGKIVFATLQDWLKNKSRCPICNARDKNIVAGIYFGYLKYRYLRCIKCEIHWGLA